MKNIFDLFDDIIKGFEKSAKSLNEAEKLFKKALKGESMEKLEKRKKSKKSKKS